MPPSSAERSEMNNPDRDLSRRDAERLLDDPASVDSALGSALSAASAPARPGELRREEMAVAAFHRARLEPAAAVPARRAGRAATRAVVATGAVVALASGGFALASSIDLPLLPDRASDRASEAVAPSSATTSATSTATSTAGSADSSATTGTPGSTESEGSESPGASASPSPDLEGLCRAFHAADRSGQGRSLDSAAFRALATAAGGPDRVATFCVDLIGSPKPKPTPSGKPSDQPTGKPTTLPTPTTKPPPTGKPTTKPTAEARRSGISE